MAEKKKKEARLDLAKMGTKAAIAAVNAKYGSNTLVLASEALGSKVTFVSTGCAPINISLGGGFPENRITEIRGPFSSLKTTLVLKGIAEFQRKYPADEDDGLAIFVDVEKSLDIDYAIKLGVDPERLVIVNPDSGEQAVDIVHELLSIERPMFFAVDSIAALVPTAEIEASMDQQSMGLHPRLVNRMMRVATARLKRSLYHKDAPSTTIVCLNQIREKIGVMYGNPETTPGGRGKDFFYGVMIRLSAQSAGKIQMKVKRNGVTRKIMIAMSVNYSVNKNKVGGSQHEEGNFMYFVRPFKHYKAHDFNNDEVLLKMGLFYDVLTLKRVGGKSVIICPDGKTTLPAQPANALKKLHKMPKLLGKLERLIMKKIVADANQAIVADDAEVEVDEEE